ARCVVAPRLVPRRTRRPPIPDQVRNLRPRATSARIFRTPPASTVPRLRDPNTGAANEPSSLSHRGTGRPHRLTLRSGRAIAAGATHSARPQLPARRVPPGAPGGPAAWRVPAAPAPGHRPAGGLPAVPAARGRGGPRRRLGWPRPPAAAHGAGPWPPPAPRPDPRTTASPRRPPGPH